MTDREKEIWNAAINAAIAELSAWTTSVGAFEALRKLKRGDDD